MLSRKELKKKLSKLKFRKKNYFWIEDMNRVYGGGETEAESVAAVQRLEEEIEIVQNKIDNYDSGKSGTI